MNDAVLKQIDSVLDNLGKKVRETEKIRMRAVMAALTGENMKCDLELRSSRRVLKLKQDAAKSKAGKNKCLGIKSFKPKHKPSQLRAVWDSHPLKTPYKPNEWGKKDENALCTLSDKVVHRVYLYMCVTNK